MITDEKPGSFTDMESPDEIELALQWWVDKVNQLYKAGLTKTEEYQTARRRMENGRYFLSKMQYSERCEANDNRRHVDIQRMRNDSTFRWDTPGEGSYSGRGMEDYLDDHLDRWRTGD